MYAAIAGLRTHMQNLNVIGHNVANVNTAGYKSQRAVFKTSLYTTLTGGSDGTTVMGGTNPSQIGYGSNVSTVDIDMSTGNYNPTGKPTDLMLDGDGFFLVGDKEIAQNFDGTVNDVDRLTSLFLTRVGNFEFKADGYFANNDGNCVYGFLCTGKWGDENNPIYQMDPTTNKPVVDANGNPVRLAPEGIKEGDPVFSDQLVPIRLPRVQKTMLYFHQEADGTLVEATEADAIDAATGDLKAGYLAKEAMEIVYPQASQAGITENTELAQGQFTGITVDRNTGLISGTSADTGEIVIIGCVGVGLVTNPNGVTSMGDNYFKAGPGSGQLTVAILGGSAEAMNITQINKSLYLSLIHISEPTRR